MNFDMGERPATPCQQCKWLDKLVDCGFGSQVAHCNIPGGPRVRSEPQFGCCSWEREVGADDE